MAEIRRVFFFRHLRSEVSRHVVQFRGGEPVRTGRGLTFWFLPWSASIAEIPVDDQELVLQITGRTQDFQVTSVQGVLTWRVADPDALARRVDCTLDLTTGQHVHTPLEQVANTLSEQAQQLACDTLAQLPLADALEHGISQVRARVIGGLRGSEALAALGVEVVSVSIRAIRPAAEVERALQVTTREQIQQQADKATFERRAVAVERERAIAENELQSQIELARREEMLIAQQGQNARREVTERAETTRLEAVCAAETSKVTSEAEAAALRALEQAKAEAERAHVDIYRDLPSDVLLGLAARELAANLPEIGSLTVTPDLITQALNHFRAEA